LCTLWTVQRRVCFLRNLEVWDGEKEFSVASAVKDAEKSWKKLKGTLKGSLEGIAPVSMNNNH